MARVNGALTLCSILIALLLYPTTRLQGRSKFHPIEQMRKQVQRGKMISQHHIASMHRTKQGSEYVQNLTSFKHNCYCFSATLSGMQDLCSPTRGSYLNPLLWKHGVLATGPPGKSPKLNCWSSLWYMSLHQPSLTPLTAQRFLSLRIVDFRAGSFLCGGGFLCKCI